MKLTAAEILELLPNLRVNERGTDLTGICPFCKEKSFGISLREDGNPYGCFRKSKCGESGTIFTLLKHLGKLSDYFEQKSFSQKQIVVIERAIQKQDEIDLETPDTKLPIGFKRIYEDDYLEERGFTEQEFKRHEVGISELDPRVGKNYRIFLVRREGVLKGYVARHIWPKKKIDRINKQYKEKGLDKVIPRYRNDASAEFSKLLYGYDSITPNTDTVIVVEGVFDKDNVDRLLELDTQDEIVCVASFGASLSREQVYLLQLKGVESIIVLYESDVLNKNKKTGVKLKDEFEKVLMGYWTGSDDPGDMNIEQLQKILDNLITPTAYRSGKLSFGFK